MAETPAMTDINRLHHSPESATALTAATSLHITHKDLPGPPEAHRFIGAHHDGVPISLFLVDDDQPGAGPPLHRHPYAEVFVVHAGEARFEIDDLRLTATAGDILIAPAMSAHRFTNSGEGRLRVTAIHTAPDMATEWIQPTTGPRGPA